MWREVCTYTSEQTTLMPRAGIYLGDATCLRQNTLKRTKRISKLSIVMAGILPSGARSECFTIRSTNIAMLLMLIHEQFG